MPANINRDFKNRDIFGQIYEAVRLVPEGRVSTYGEIARFVGAGRSARLVGWALKAGPADVPAHRIVNKQGLLTGRHRFNPPELMQRLLEGEGIEVKDNKVQNMEEHIFKFEL